MRVQQVRQVFSNICIGYEKMFDICQGLAGIILSISLFLLSEQISIEIGNIYVYIVFLFYVSIFFVEKINENVCGIVLNTVQCPVHTKYFLNKCFNMKNGGSFDPPLLWSIKMRLRCWKYVWWDLPNCVLALHPQQDRAGNNENCNRYQQQYSLGGTEMWSSRHMLKAYDRIMLLQGEAK